MNGCNLKSLNLAEEKPLYKLFDKQGNEIKTGNLRQLSNHIQKELSQRGDHRNSGQIHGDLYRTINRKNNFVGGFRAELVKDKGV